MPPAFARGFPAHFQGRFGSNLMGPGATRPLERNMQTRPSRNGRGHFFLCTWNAKKSCARGEPKKSSLDTATCSRDAWVTCNILRNNVLKRFSFRWINRNWEGKCWRTHKRGAKVIRFCGRLQRRATGNPAERRHRPSALLRVWARGSPSGEQVPVGTGDLIHHGLCRESFYYQAPFRRAHLLCVGWIGEEWKESFRRRVRIFQANKAPSDPVFTASALPPTSLATTGRNDAMASMTTMGKPPLR